jgi:hypothetical protein
LATSASFPVGQIAAVGEGSNRPIKLMLSPNFPDAETCAALAWVYHHFPSSPSSMPSPHVIRPRADDRNLEISFDLGGDCRPIGGVAAQYGAWSYPGSMSILENLKTEELFGRCRLGNSQRKSHPHDENDAIRLGARGCSERRRRGSLLRECEGEMLSSGCPSSELESTDSLRQRIESETFMRSDLESIKILRNCQFPEGLIFSRPIWNRTSTEARHLRFLNESALNSRVVVIFADGHSCTH